jgi:uncharacterized protein
MSGPKLSPQHLARLRGAEDLDPSPIPTHWISNGEYMPLPRTRQQEQVEELVNQIADRNRLRFGLSRRDFLSMSCGLATAFLAMNAVFGDLFEVSAAEANNPTAGLWEGNDGSEFILDIHTHFVRDDFPLDAVTAQFIGLGDALIALERALLATHKQYKKADYGLINTGNLQQDLDQIKIQNYIKWMFLESDTHMALLSDATANPDHPEREFLTDETRAELRDAINAFAGSERVLASALLKPRHDGWTEWIDHAISDLLLDCWKGFTLGQNTFYPDPELPWRLDDFDLLHDAFYAKVLAADNPRIKNITIHKGLIAPDYPVSFGMMHTNPTAGQPDLFGISSNGGMEPATIPAWHFNTMQDVPRAAQAYPELNFIIYHSAFRPAIGVFEPAAIYGVTAAELDGYFLRNYLPTIDDEHPRGVMPWLTDLASIPGRFGVSNVYTELGSVFGPLVVTDPEFAALLVGILIEGLGPENVLWGTDAVLLGKPQWVIEAFRRIKIFETFERHFGVSPTSGHDELAEAEVKKMILGRNSARLFNIDVKNSLKEIQKDAFSRYKGDPSYSRDHLNRAFGLVW